MLAVLVNLPPTLVDSQVSSVRKIIKLKLLSLLKHPASFDFQPQITTLLTDLGATQAEVCFSSPIIVLDQRRFFRFSNIFPKLRRSTNGKSRRAATIPRRKSRKQRR